MIYQLKEGKKLSMCQTGVPLVTAIITTHNRHLLAEKAIESVFAQTYPHIELIVVDDASESEASDYLADKALTRNFKYIYISNFIIT